MQNLELYDIGGIYAVATYYDESESYDAYQAENEYLESCGIGIVTMDRRSHNGGDLEVIRHYDNALEDIERCQLEIEDAEHDLLLANTIDAINHHANAVLDKAKAEFDLQNDYCVVGGEDEDRLICDLDTFRKSTGNQFTGEKLEEQLKEVLKTYLGHANGEVTTIVVAEITEHFDWEEFADDPYNDCEPDHYVAPVGYVLERDLPKKLQDWGLIGDIGKHHKAKAVYL